MLFRSGMVDAVPEKGFEIVYHRNYYQTIKSQKNITINKIYKRLTFTTLRSETCYKAMTGKKA